MASNTSNGCLEIEGRIAGVVGDVDAELQFAGLVVGGRNQILVVRIVAEEVLDDLKCQNVDCLVLMILQ